MIVKFGLLQIMLMQVLLLLFMLPIVEEHENLYNTEDSLSVEFYDCVEHNKFLYCRRPIAPIVLQRENEAWECDHNGIVHSFASLLKENISVNTVLHDWGSTIEKAEEYSRYIKQSIKSIDEIENYLCECTDPQSFGKYCEYLLPVGVTFEETLIWEIKMKMEEDGYEMQMYGDILCYTTLICDSGLLCLDWRDICDGVQQCMFGYDEENCDKLEFNECEHNEYRCMNGMCIPDEYFLDGDYDCMDMTDEKDFYDNRYCTFEQVSLECDDRMCSPNEYSCGDGQCIVDRFAFQKQKQFSDQCRSRRDQYYMCETHRRSKLWTLPNGRCYWNPAFEQLEAPNRSSIEECIYLLQCVLSYGARLDCPSNADGYGIKQIKTRCPLALQYPAGAIIAPYIFHFFNITTRPHKFIPNFIKINASIKCREHTIHSHMILPYNMSMNLRQLEELLCMSSSNHSTVFNSGYDSFCYNDSQTFNNHSYNFIDVCSRSKECISAYRIEDGWANCADKMDEDNKELVTTACSKIHGHRFRCSANEPTCLLINGLGDGVRHCSNGYDEAWMGKDLLFSKLNCNSNSKEHCGMIRQYIEDSWNVEAVSEVTVPFQSAKKIPFRAYCDTFWDTGSKEDENFTMCEKWWLCLEDQWQCRTGQCINADWVLDGDWDCSDASDEEGIFTSNQTLLSHNLRIVKHSKLAEKFKILYSRQPFWNICNFTIEFPCFPINYSYSLINKSRERPCINLEQIGDGNVDCLGSLDERNTAEHCSREGMLGYAFKCISSGTCIDYFDICESRCPHITDDKLICDGFMDSANCTDIDDFMCMDGTCIKNGRCDDYRDCFYGEDEYICSFRYSSEESLQSRWYRIDKESVMINMQQNLNLPLFPASMERTTTSNIVNSSTIQRTLAYPTSSNVTSSLIAYVCNRGVGIYFQNSSITCFCPQQYYGDKCQYYSDRMTLFVHLNLSQSNYNKSTNPSLVLKMVVLFLFQDEIVAINEFHVKPTVEITVPKKEIIHFLYSRSTKSLNEKRQRYFNRSDIIHNHPYSIRIEAYELNLNKTPKFLAVWQYPIYFDYLPTFRFAKVLYLTKIENITDPCLSNPCGEHYECHQLLNQQHDYICLCSSHFMGNDCSILNQQCSNDFCSSNALCKPNYRGLLSGNQFPYCICPLGRYGRRCELIYDPCDSNPCQNQGVCLPSGKVTKYYCQCIDPYHGKQCELWKQTISLHINQSVLEHRIVVIQYLQRDFSTFDLHLIQQNIFTLLPEILYYSYDNTKPTEIIIAKQYFDLQSEIYILLLQININPVNVTTQMNQINRCINVQMLFPTREEISPFKYHHLCLKNNSLFCFFDPIYLCICDKNRSRVECFGYDHNLDRCLSCFFTGQCIQGDRSKINDFLCICSQCHYGNLCQFSNEGLSFTLDSLIIQVNRSIQIIYFIFILLIFLVGGITNYASIVTFKRPNLRNSSVGIYLLILSLIGQYSLFSLIMKMILIIFDFLMNDLSCKILSFMLSVSIRCSFWLTSWIAIERVCYLLFPFATLLKKPRVALIISLITLLIIGSMHAHEFIFYMKDPSGQTACVVNYPLNITIYNRITVLIHYLIPFCIQILSVTVLIILAARSRSRSTNNRDTFIKYLKRQFKSQKELYITPIVIVVSGLPQAILSFSFSCIQLSTWQQHTLFIAYLLSYVPQLLGFVLFVLPSTSYMKEFQATNVSKIFLFRWIISIMKLQTRTVATTIT